MRIVSKITCHNILPSALAVIFLLICPRLHTQDSIVKMPAVTSDWNDYLKQVKDDPARQMVELKSQIPGLIYDLRYATAENFMRRLMYPEKTSVTFLRLPAANALQKVQSALHKEGFGLKIFDAYRPYSVTVKFWELLKDERYVANPARGSGHNRGVAVDLTIIDLKQGKELDMGTGFDNFSDTAHHDFTQLPAPVLKNRKLLRTLMEKYGFVPLETEWWHYSLPEAARFEILDLSFEKLRTR